MKRHTPWTQPALAAALILSLAFSPASGKPEAKPAVDQEDLALLKRASKAFSAVAEKAVPAVVFISVEKNVNAGMMPPQALPFNDPHNFFGDEFMRRFFGDPRQQQQQRQFKQQGQGSGFLITRDGYILTNNHVVGDADKIRVKTSDGREYDARRIGSDPKSEVALIKIDGDNFPFLSLGSSASLRIGEWVVAIGNPFGLNETLTVGVVSAKGRSGMGIADYEDFIQTDAAINPGNSGGPLLNIEGEVIGINTAIYSQNGGYMGIGFAIPIDLAAKIKDQLLKTGKVVRGFLGIQIQDMSNELAPWFNMKEPEGILVYGVQPDAAAAKGGIERGDIILELNGRKIESTAAFRNEIASSPPGTEISLLLLRNGDRKSLKLKTGSMDGSEELAGGAESPVEGSTSAEKIGIEVQSMDKQMADRFGYTLGEGVVVSAVEPGGIAAAAGIEPGDLIASVNRTPVRSPDEFSRALAKPSKSGRLLLDVRRGAFGRYVVVETD